MLPGCSHRRFQRVWGSINCPCVPPAGPGTHGRALRSPGRAVCSPQGCPGGRGDVGAPGRNLLRPSPPPSWPFHRCEYRVKSNGFSGVSLGFHFLLFAFVCHAARKRSYRLSQPRSPSPAAFQDFHSKTRKGGNYRETDRKPQTTQRLPPRPVQPKRLAACRCPIRTPIPILIQGAARCPPVSPPPPSGGRRPRRRAEGGTGALRRRRFCSLNRSPKRITADPSTSRRSCPKGVGGGRDGGGSISPPPPHPPALLPRGVGEAARGGVEEAGGGETRRTTDTGGMPRRV